MITLGTSDYFETGPHYYIYNRITLGTVPKVIVYIKGLLWRPSKSNHI